MLVVKSPPDNAGDIRDAISIPGLGRSTGEGHGNPLQYSCLENPVVRGAWWAMVHRVAESQTQLKWLRTAHSIHRVATIILISLLRMEWPSDLLRSHWRWQSQALEETSLPKEGAWVPCLGLYHQGSQFEFWHLIFISMGTAPASEALQPRGEALWELMERGSVGFQGESGTTVSLLPGPGEGVVQASDQLAGWTWANHLIF